MPNRCWSACAPAIAWPAANLVALSELAHDVLGIAPEALFPAWALTQRQALDTAGIAPPTIELADTDLAAIRWADQPDIDWILLIPSLAAAHTQTIIRPVTPRQPVPFTLQWKPDRVHTIAVARFVHCALAADLPPGWYTQPDHLHHTEPDQDPADPHPALGGLRISGQGEETLLCDLVADQPAPHSTSAAHGWPHEESRPTPARRLRSRAARHPGRCQCR